MQDVDAGFWLGSSLNFRLRFSKTSFLDYLLIREDSCLRCWHLEESLSNNSRSLKGICISKLSVAKSKLFGNWLNLFEQRLLSSNINNSMTLMRTFFCQNIISNPLAQQ